MKKILVLSSVLWLTACASTITSAVKDTSTNVNRTAEYIRENPEVVDKSIDATGSILKIGGDMLGKMGEVLKGGSGSGK